MFQTNILHNKFWKPKELFHIIIRRCRCRKKQPVSKDDCWWYVAKTVAWCSIVEGAPFSTNCMLLFKGMTKECRAFRDSTKQLQIGETIGLNLSVLITCISLLSYLLIVIGIHFYDFGNEHYNFSNSIIFRLRLLCKMLSNHLLECILV